MLFQTDQTKSKILRRSHQKYSTEMANTAKAIRGANVTQLFSQHKYVRPTASHPLEK